MLDTPAPFPHVGSICYRRHTAEPALILRHNADRTVLLERRRATPWGGLQRIEGASANCTVPLADIFPDKFTAIFGSVKKAQRARRHLAPRT